MSTSETMTPTERAAIEAALGNFKATAELAVKMYELSGDNSGSQGVEVGYETFPEGGYFFMRDYSREDIVKDGSFVLSIRI